jgi:hypothetical protein
VAWILDYGSTSSAGSTTKEFWQSLALGRECFRPASQIQNRMPHHVQISPELKVHTWDTPEKSASERLLDGLLKSWSETRTKLSPSVSQRISKGDRFGIIFASTKGLVDDLVWEETPNVQAGARKMDPLTPVFFQFLKRSELNPARKIVVSNACASGLSAVFLASQWLKQGSVEDVLIIVGDTLGAFVIKGFECLRVFAKDHTQPFSASRSGFFLGEGCAALLMSAYQEEGALEVLGAGVDAEGYAVTRPSPSGESLKRACRQIPNFEAADFIVAHGTATVMNDIAEDAAYTELFLSRETPWITSTKWCIGHTLGASSLFDLIAACEILRQQELFAIATTETVDPKFCGRYLTAANMAQAPATFQKGLISSLGFGGIQAALLIGGS